MTEGEDKRNTKKHFTQHTTAIDDEYGDATQKKDERRKERKTHT